MKPRRVWFRLSVRGLMALVVVVGGLIGWEVNQVGRMRLASTVLHRLVPLTPEELADPEKEFYLRVHRPTGPDQPEGSRVEVAFDDWYRDGSYLERPRPEWLPDWVRVALGGDHFRRVEEVTFYR